jgi:hypothetical protein
MRIGGVRTSDDVFLAACDSGQLGMAGRVLLGKRRLTTCPGSISMAIFVR